MSTLFPWVLPKHYSVSMWSGLPPTIKTPVRILESRWGTACGLQLVPWNSAAVRWSASGASIRPTSPTEHENNGCIMKLSGPLDLDAVGRSIDGVYGLRYCVRECFSPALKLVTFEPQYVYNADESGPFVALDNGTLKVFCAQK